jgi:hypothetical protein
MKRIKRNIERIAKLVAEWLTSKTEKLSKGKKKVGLLLFCILFGGISLYIVFVPMISSSVLIQRPVIPRHIGKTNQKPDNRISKKLFDRIEVLKNDDSLMKAHPQLLDSIHLFEQLYQSQIKK